MRLLRRSSLYGLAGLLALAVALTLFITACGADATATPTEVPTAAATQRASAHGGGNPTAGARRYTNTHISTGCDRQTYSRGYSQT